MRKVALLLTVGCLLGGDVKADSGSAPVQKLMRSHSVTQGFKGYLKKQTGRFGPVRSDLAITAVVRFSQPLDAERIAQLEANGLTFERTGQRLANIGNFYGVRGSASALADILDNGAVRRILSPAPRMIPPSPLDSSFDKVHQQTTAKKLWSQRDDLGQTLTGAGVVICDIDGAADIFHPMFFRPDAGYYNWLDLNGDKTLQPDQDAVDLNGNGRFDRGEKLLSLGGDVVDLYYGHIIDPARGFDPSRQWLYVDTDQSGSREYGPDNGFSEQDAAYGEPLFLADDVNRNGRVDVGEKLMRMGSSKFKGIFRPASGERYMRGENLIDLPQNPDAGHGTGVGGILVGGEYGHNYIHGVAPDADLLLISQDWLDGEEQNSQQYEASLLAAMSWAQEQGAQVFLHEYGQPYGEFADGSGEWEQLLDTLSEQGAVQTTATHNFADNLGHAEVTVGAGETLNIPFEIYDFSGYGYQLYYLLGTLRWRSTSGVALEAQLTMADGVTVDLQGEVQENLAYASTTSGFSSRGTGMLDFYTGQYNASSGQPTTLPPGNWNLSITNPDSQDLDVYIVITDETIYSMAVGLGLGTTNLGTIAHPATADSAISVGASVGNTVDDGEIEDGLKLYSGRGPRIDGELGVDVIAPEDHYTAAPVSDASGVAHYMSFGGTSGALPQVAGAVALLLQKDPSLTPAEVKAAIHQHSSGDILTGTVPNAQWGYGRLTTYNLVMGEDPVDNTAPIAKLSLPDSVTVGKKVKLDGSDSSDDQDSSSAMLYSFDLDYDGEFDVQGGDAVVSRSFAKAGKFWVKLQVQDTAGATSSVLAQIEVKQGSDEVSHEAGCGCQGISPKSSLVGLLPLLLAMMGRRFYPKL